MKNIQVRVEDSLKEKSDKLFKALGTSTNEAIKIFLKMSVNKNGFPFAIQMEKIHTLEEWLEEKMLHVDEEAIMEAYSFVEGSFTVDQDFELGVVNEKIELYGFINEEDDDSCLLAQARLKCVDNRLVDPWEAADADSSDYETVAARIGKYTNVFDEADKIAFLDEFFVFSREVSAKNRVKLFYDYFLPYLKSRSIEFIVFMNAGFWRTDGVEEQKALSNAFAEYNISVVTRDKDWSGGINMLEII